MKLGPLDYFGRIEFTQDNFPDIWLPVVLASIVFLIGTIVLYNVRVVAAIFNWYFLFVLVILIVGIATLVWIRFFRFPPYIQAYNEQLRRTRFFNQSRHKAAEATVRSKRARGSQRRRRS